MVSRLHEGLIELVRGEPSFIADVLAGLLHVDVPRFTGARLSEATLNELAPVEYSADAVVLFGAPRPVFGVVVEAQLRRHKRKRFTWPLYVVAARARHECQFMLVVVTPKPSTARWAAHPIEIGGGMVQRPYVIGPDRIPPITDRGRAMREPRLAMLSAMAHGHGDPHIAAAIAIAAAAAIGRFPEEQRMLYSGLLDTALSEAARKELRMSPNWERFMSESQRQGFAKGEALGRAKGQAEGRAEGRTEGRAEGRAEGATKALAEAVFLVLKQRKLLVTKTQQRRIAGCQDAVKLRRWLARAVSARSVSDLLSGR
jgi:hypothetical protein